MDFASWKIAKASCRPCVGLSRRRCRCGPGRTRGLRARSVGSKYPAIAQSWRRNWELVIPLFAFPEGVRLIIYTTNAIEALNSKLRRAVRTRGHFLLTMPQPSCYIWFSTRRRGMEKTAARVGRGKDAVRRHVQRALRELMTDNRPHTEILTVPSRRRWKWYCQPSGRLAATTTSSVRPMHQPSS